MAVLLSGCGSKTNPPFTDEQLMEICDDVDSYVDDQIDGMEYKDVYGTSDSEQDQEAHFYKVYNKLRDRAIKKHKISTNSPITVTGKVSAVETLKNGEIHIYLGDITNKKKVLYYPVICSTYDEAFLAVEQGDEITIEGVFYKKGRQEEHISDCVLQTES